MSDAGFKRVYCSPNKLFSYTSGLGKLSPRSAYILAQSQLRFSKRVDALWPIPELRGEFGYVENFRFIETKVHDEE